MTGIVLGSGLAAAGGCGGGGARSHVRGGGLAGFVGRRTCGQVRLRQTGTTPVLLMMGRVHLYEGHPPRAVTAGVRWMAQQGVRRLILTNAAGTLNPDFQPGSWMMFSDHLNLTGTSPLEGPDFVDLTAAYDPAWRAEFRAAAAASNMPLHEGVYAGLRGPQYETPAEIRMLRTLGADAVGMSTVLETIQARSLGLPVAAFSCLTNWAAGISPAPLDHHEVLQTGQQAAQAMVGLLRGAGKGI